MEKPIREFTLGPSDGVLTNQANKELQKGIQSSGKGEEISDKWDSYKTNTRKFKLAYHVGDIFISLM